jgi:hypothetical protein
MSVDQGQQFYGFLEKVFLKKLGFLVEKKLRSALPGTFDFEIGEDEFASMTDILRRKNAHCEVAKIIEYMTGRHPDRISARERTLDGTTKCLALLYQGEHAIDQIRDKLGPTDPNKAEGGTVRSDYGRDLMKNGAHASDSVESALRERPIVGLMGGEPSMEKKLIRTYLNGKLV